MADRLLIIAAVAMLALPGAAFAQGITYYCDTAANHWSELVLPAGAINFTVTGKVRLNATAASKQYVPQVRIQIAAAPSAAGETPSAYAGFTLTAMPVDPRKAPDGASAIQILGWMANGKEDELLPLSFLTKPGTVQAFALTYDGSSVSVDLGTDKKSFALRTAAPVVRVTCSTGEFLLTDLLIKAGG